MGLKAIAIYRDNSKYAQPLSMTKKGGDANNQVIEAVEEVKAAIDTAVQVAVAEALIPGHAPLNAQRHELRKVRNAKTFKFTIAGIRGYFTVGEYDDGTPGELFVSIAKQGSTLRGVMDAFATSASYGLQYGVPLKKFVRTFTNTSFAPAGITDDPDIRTASSIIDYIFRRLGKTYLNFDDQLEVGLASIDDMPIGQTSLLSEEIKLPTPSVTMDESIATSALAPDDLQPQVPEAVQPTRAVYNHSDSAPLCYNCGNQTQKAGSCFVCTSCGSTTGCS
jgi:ribonucleoside-diphosphate reductase alpha chain